MNGKIISLVVIALVIGGAFFMMSKGGKQQNVGIPVKMPELSTCGSSRAIPVSGQLRALPRGECWRNQEGATPYS